jgi:hypothetical protein
MLRHWWYSNPLPSRPEHLIFLVLEPVVRYRSIHGFETPKKTGKVIIFTTVPVAALI